MSYILITIYLSLSAAGLILFKLGSTAVKLQLTYSIHQLSINVGTLSLIGLVCYLMSFILYMGIITKYDLTRIYPVTAGAVYIFVFIGSIIFLHEPISINKIIGSITILFGIVMINL